MMVLIETNSDPVCVWWRGQKQWAVTAYGIESLDGQYRIEASCLLNMDHPLPMAMAEKNWVNIEEFTTAWMVALLLHGKAGRANPKEVLKMLARLPNGR